jgi:hypothetical protein
MKHGMAFSMGLLGLVSAVVTVAFNLFFLLIPLLFAACIAIPIFFWKGPIVRPFVWRGLASFLLVSLVGPCAAILGVALAGNIVSVVYHPQVGFIAQYSVFTWQNLFGFLVVMVVLAFIWALCLYIAVQILTGGRDKRLILAIAIATEFVSLAAFVLGFLWHKPYASEVVNSSCWVIGELLVTGVLLGMSLDGHKGAIKTQERTSQ